MALSINSVGKINQGEFTPDILNEFVHDFIKTMKEDIIQRFHREKRTDDERRFAEFVLIETCRALLKQPGVVFYLHLKNDPKLREILNLRYMKTYGQYTDFDKKRKYLKKDLSRIIERNLKTKNFEIYALDTFITEVDLNRYRKGKKIEAGGYDVEYLHSTSKGTVVGFLVAVLVNLSDLSVEDIQIFTKEVKKTKIWEDVVLKNIGTVTGKIKVVIADAGLFAYQNYEVSPNMRLVPVIKPRSGLENKVARKLRELEPNIMWFDSRLNNDVAILLDEFKEIISSAVEMVKSYDDISKLRSRINT